MEKLKVDKPDVKVNSSSLGGGEQIGDGHSLKPRASDSGKAEEYPPVDTHFFVEDDVIARGGYKWGRSYVY